VRLCGNGAQLAQMIANSTAKACSHVVGSVLEQNGEGKFETIGCSMKSCVANIRDAWMSNPPIFGSHCESGKSIFGIHCLWCVKPWLSYAGFVPLGSGPSISSNMGRSQKLACSFTKLSRLSKCPQFARVACGYVQGGMSNHPINRSDKYPIPLKGRGRLLPRRRLIPLASAHRYRLFMLCCRPLRLARKQISQTVGNVSSNSHISSPPRCPTEQLNGYFDASRSCFGVLKETP
jgi:hypothetical protein